MVRIGFLPFNNGFYPCTSLQLLNLIFESSVTLVALFILQKPILQISFIYFCMMGKEKGKKIQAVNHTLKEIFYLTPFSYLLHHIPKFTYLITCNYVERRRYTFTLLKVVNCVSIKEMYLIIVLDDLCNIEVSDNTHLSTNKRFAQCLLQKIAFWKIWDLLPLPLHPD